MINLEILKNPIAPFVGMGIIVLIVLIVKAFTKHD